MQIAISSSARNEAGRIWGGDREAATSISKTETEDLFRDTGRKIRAKSILRGASSNGTYIEHARWD